MNNPQQKRPKISIIVPCYNSANTIRRCIDSILSQSFPNIELLVIDDGSSDESVNIIEEYGAMDSRIKLIKRKHGGPNMAREAGVKKASGEYIMFVDSDDYIIKDATEILINAIKKYEVDSVRFNSANVYNNKIIQPIIKQNNNYKIINSGEIIKLLLTTYSLNNLWSQIYKADKIKKAQSFHTGIVFGEDFLVNLEVHKNTDKMLVLSGKPLYYYCDNPNSTTRSIDKNRILKNISDRVYVSSQAILYARNNIKDDNLKNKIIYSQIKMIKGSVMQVSKIKNYTKNEFIKDVSKILGQESFTCIDLRALNKYMRTLDLLEKLKNFKPVLSLLSLNYNCMWKYVVIYRIYFKLKRGKNK